MGPENTFPTALLGDVLVYLIFIIPIFSNKAVQKLQFLNSSRLKNEEKRGFPRETRVFLKTCSITDRVIEQVHYLKHLSTNPLAQ
jgi:hypothetical protein